MGFFSDLFDRVKHDQSVQWATFSIPAKRVLDPPTDAETDAFTVNQTYFELRVSQMYLRDRREYLRGFVPLASLLTRFQFDGRRCVLPAIVGPETLQGAAHVNEDDPIEIYNRRVAGPFPYEGEDVELFAGLFRVEVQNWAKQTLAFAETIGKALDVTKLSSYLGVADALSQAVYELLGMQELEFRLGTDRTYIGVAQPGSEPSASLLRPGFDLVMGADDRDIPEAVRERLWVKDARLHVGDHKDDLKRYRDHDFLLLRTAALTRRDDYTSFPFHTVHWPRIQAQVWAGQPEAAQSELGLLGGELAQLRDITRGHRAALVAQYRTWYQDEADQYAALVQGAGETPGFEGTSETPARQPITEDDLARAVEEPARAAPGDDAALFRRLTA